MKPDYENLLEYFPFDEFRGNQYQILLHLQEYLLDPDVDFIVCQAATGIGKSALALALARAAKQAYIATANKALQDQYVRDFEHLLVNLKGRANYRCNTYKPPVGQKPFNCGNSPCRKTKASRAACGQASACEYHAQRLRASKASVTSFNFAAALPFLNYQSALFKPRNLLVCDEAHSVWQWLTDFVAVTLNSKVLKELGILDAIPDYYEVGMYVGLIEKLQSAVKFQLELDDESSNSDGSRVEKLENLKNKLDLFDVITAGKTELDNFVIDKTWDISNPHVVKSVSFKPIVVSDLLQEYFYNHGKKTVLLSAVILDFDTYLDVMGIDPKRVKILNLDSPFPAANRPIITHQAVGRLSRKSMPENLPKLINKTEEILEHHDKHKGIIHGVSWKLCRDVYNGLSYKTKAKVLLAPTPGEQKDILQEHQKTPDPTVLLSPSMTEGVDLKDDLSRVQIILKVPYPYLGDPVVEQRMKLYENFYYWQTAQALIQMYGRSIRSETDWCFTYVLDGNFKTFVDFHGWLLPRSFHEALVHG